MADDFIGRAPESLQDALDLLSIQQAEIEGLRIRLEAMNKALSHDLRAPLRHVISFAPLLCETIEEIVNSSHCDAQLASDAREFAQTMEQSARKMADMLVALVQRPGPKQ